MQVPDDRISGGGPAEGLAVRVVGGRELVDSLHELCDDGERAAMNDLRGIVAQLVTDAVRIGPISEGAVKSHTETRFQSGLINAYMVRHKVRPGITGWAQINGYRGETDSVEQMRARVECDLNYLRNWSLGLDLQIVLRTILTFMWDRKAY